MSPESFGKCFECIKADAERLGVFFAPPLTAIELEVTARAIQEELGLTIPLDYLGLLSRTNGIRTQHGRLESLQVIGEQNALIWFFETKLVSDAPGMARWQVEPLPTPQTPTYIWLGYDGNTAQQIYDLATDEFRQIALGADGGFEF